MTYQMPFDWRRQRVAPSLKISVNLFCSRHELLNPIFGQGSNAGVYEITYGFRVHGFGDRDYFYVSSITAGASRRGSYPTSDSRKIAFNPFSCHSHRINTLDKISIRIKNMKNVQAAAVQVVTHAIAVAATQQKLSKA